LPQTLSLIEQGAGLRRATGHVHLQQAKDPAHLQKVKDPAHLPEQKQDQG
tara:strand:+ start:249 stop:398 length:150 start_codon:yes stop_codon:yes gene_type:complete